MRIVPVLIAGCSLLELACAYPVTSAGSSGADTRARPAAAEVRATGTAAGATEARIFDLINAERRHQGLRPLVFNARLNQMARIQAQNMAYYQKMAHVLPNATLPTLGDRAQYVGYNFGRIAENVALGYPNAETVVEGWMNSRGHRQNILDAGVVETGIAVARSATGGLYYCQVFGRQL
ncbi:MAG TPA: CAP domain-containing protein [Gemmatimonadaceae bacterium]|nr:CAP domain-containing protein [Gemmatimonadaceae bacterium]